MVPFVVIIFAFLGWANDIVSAPANNLEGQTSSLAEQILSSVRIVQSFNMGGGLIKRFDGDLLKRLQKLGAKRSVIRSLEQSSVYFALFLLYSLAFWFGGIEVRAGLATGHVLTVSSAIYCLGVRHLTAMTLLHQVFLQLCQSVVYLCKRRTSHHKHCRRSSAAPRTSPSNRASTIHRRPR